MRILNDDSDEKLDKITLFLTQNEIKQLLGYLKQLSNSSPSDHVHLSNDDYQKEITICSYDITNLNNLNERSKKLILEDK